MNIGVKVRDRKVRVEHVFVFAVVVVVLGSVAMLHPGAAHAQASCGSIIEEDDGEIYETPIEDCDNPFGIIEENPNLKAFYGDTEIIDGNNYEFGSTTNESFSLTDTDPRANDIFLTLYKHEGNNYVVKTYDYSYTFSATGTYTLVISENNLQPSFNIFERFRSLIIPTAYAFPGVSRAFTFNVVAPPPPEPEPTGASSILFLPGLQASRLYKDGLFGTEDQLWEPNIDQDLRQLDMTEEGESVEDVYTRDIVDEALGFLDIYKGFSNFLTQLVSDEVIADWQPFAYDWRYSVMNIAEEGTQYENEMRDAITLIEELATSSLSDKVTIIAHSNGGLLAKALMIRLEREGKSNLIDKVIFVASPQLGTPKAIASILHGYDQSVGGGLIVSESTARDVVRRMPGPLGLTPIQKYFDKDPGLLVTFDTSVSTAFLRAAYGAAIDDETELLEFMTGGTDGRNANPTEDKEPVTVGRSLLERAFDDHEASLDSWAAPEGIEVYEIVGVGLDTLRGLEYREFIEEECTTDIFGRRTCVQKKTYGAVPQFTQYGDATVVGYSAEGYAGEKIKLFSDLKKARQLGESVKHADITELSYLQRLVEDIVTGTSSSIDTITSTTPNYDDDRLLFGAHSPVSLSVTDSAGNKVERGSGNYPTEDIEGGQYLEFGGSTYVLVPKGDDYKVEVRGTGYGGVTFTLDELRGEDQSTLVSVHVATITPSTTIDIQYENSELANLLIDENGDGVTDIEMTPEGEIVNIPVTYTDLKNAIQSLSLAPLYKKVLLAFVITAEELDKRSKTNPKLTQLEVFTLSQLEATLKLYVKKRLLTQSQIDPILSIISKLKI